MTNEEICDLMEWHQRVAEAHMGDLLDKIRTVVEAEREACAKLCETRRPVSREECPAHWRAYESAWGLREQVANECAAAIRMRSNAELSGPRPLAAEGSRSNDVLERGGKGD